jgi:hypothetical protein
MKTITVTLNANGGPLDVRYIEVNDDDDPAELSHAIWQGIDDWTLLPGDTIYIGDLP